MDATLANCKKLKDVLNVMKDLVDEGNLVCDVNGISMQSLDASHIAFCEFKLTPKFFDAYVCPSQVNMGVSLKQFSKLLQSIQKEKNTSIKLSKKKDQLGIELCQDDKTFGYDLKLMDIDQEQLSIQNLDWDAKVTLDAKLFKDVISNLDDFGMNLIMQLNQSTDPYFVLKVDGSMGTSITKLRGLFDCKRPIDVMFSMRYMQRFVQGTGLAEKVHLYISNHAPIRVTYEFSGEDGELNFYLAPKTANDS